MLQAPVRVDSEEMKFAIAQTRPKDTVEENLRDHCRMLDIAAAHRADLIIFPEMSMTGYTRDDADELGFDVNDDRLGPIRLATASHHVIAVTGAPIRMNGALYIGSFILFPDHSQSLYIKQFLHPGEELHFSPSFDHNPLIRSGEERISLAICADIDHPDHGRQARDRQSSVYASSIFFTPAGTSKAHDRMRACASTHSMDTLISNYCGPVWNMESGGRSAFWSRQGKLVGALEADRPGLLLVEKVQGNWSGEAVPF